MNIFASHWTPQNEYTCPLEGTPYYRNSGLIYASDSKGEKFLIGQIDHERFDDQNFQYVLSPAWHMIDALPPSIFQGIPGYDLSLRLDHYYRVNMTPVFISERTPGTGREDLQELLESVGLDYYDRFEWLLRTDMRCGTDNLTVERLQTCHNQRILAYREALKSISSSKLQPTDCISVNSFLDIANSASELRAGLLPILSSGASLYLEDENRELSSAERGAMVKLLLTQQLLDEKKYKQKQAEGIAEAQKAGKYTGRKKIPVDPKLLHEIAQEFKEKRISEQEAMARLGITSRSTFYRRLKEIAGG